MRVNLTKKEIINSVFMQIGFSKKMSESILEDILSYIVKNLKKYKVVKISNFGTFHIRFKKSRVGRNPRTREEKIIKEVLELILESYVVTTFDTDFVLKHNKWVIGHVSLKTKKERTELLHLFVDSKYRRKGLGLKLLKETESYIIDSKIESITAKVQKGT